LTNEETNWNSTLGALLSSREFLRVATYQPVYAAAYQQALAQGAPAQVAAQIAAGAAGQTSSIYSSLGLGSVYGADALANAANPASMRRVALDYNPTYYAQEKQFQAKFFHDFGKMSLNVTGGYAENTVDSRTDYSNSVEAPLTGNAGLATLYAYSQAPGAMFPGGVNPFAPIAQALIPNGPAGGVCQSDINGNDGGVYSGATIGCHPQSLDPDRSTANYKQWSVEAHVDSHFDGMFNFLLGGIYVDQKTRNNEYEISNFGVDYASGLLGSVPAFLGALPPGIMAGTPFYNNDEARYRLKSYGIFGETYFDLGEKLKLTLGLRYNHDHKFLAARTTLLQDSTGTLVYLPYGSTDLSEALNYAALDYDTNRDGLQPYAEDTVSFSRLTGRAVIDYKITDDNLLYASYSRGYKSGGINPPLSNAGVATTFKPEAVNAFEVGSKNTFLDGTLQLNLTGFYYKYKNLQLARIVERTAVNDNVDADIYGIEAEAVISPIHDFVINANFSYLHTKVTADELLPDPRDPSGGDPNAVIIKDLKGGANCAITSALGGAAARGFVDTVNAGIGAAVGDPGLFEPATQVLSNGTFGAYSICEQLNAATQDPSAGGAFTYYDTGVPVNLRGNHLPQAPTYKFAVGAQYTIHTGGDTTLVPRVDLNYTGNAYASIFNDLIDRMQGYEIVNAQLQFNGPDDRWYIRGFAKNLTGNNAITGQYVTDQSTGLFTNVFTVEPRQFGAAVGFKF
jgi:outer membrane receptor protein involved in Fe transport